MSELEPSISENEPPAAPAAEAAAPVSEEEAWAAVRAAWADEDAHRRYLARFTDIEGLAVAGRRYRAALDARPDDAVAQRMRAEVLKKATAYGLASLPRTPPPAASVTVKRVRMAVALSLGSLIAWGLYKLLVVLMRAWS